MVSLTECLYVMCGDPITLCDCCCAFQRSLSPTLLTQLQSEFNSRLTCRTYSVRGMTLPLGLLNSIAAPEYGVDQQEYNGGVGISGFRQEYTEASR